MAEVLILEFDGVGRAEYEAVNAALGIDPNTREGDWPPGMRYHGAGEGDGGLLVYEVWETREAQQDFMHNRLQPALAEGGISGPPRRVEWLALVGDMALD